MQPELHPILVVTSCDRKDTCSTLSRAILENKLAACIQVSAPVESMYWWQGEVVEDREYVVSIKTEKRLFAELADLIRSIHPYDVPEIAAVDIVAIDEAYARWMVQSMK